MTPFERFLAAEDRALLGEELTRALCKLFEKSNPKVSAEQVSEFLKFAKIASVRRETFLPCTREIDLVWHALIVETAAYRRFCERIHKGFFLEHAGLSFEDYSSERSSEELNLEDLEVLVTYVANFGDFLPETIHYWVAANELIKETGMLTHEVNQFLKKLTGESGES
jgi:hypothetical protein